MRSHFTGERFGLFFLQVLVTGMVTNYEQKIPSQVNIAFSKCHTNCDMP